MWTLLYDVFTKDDTFLAFLPLAHILEFVVENSFIFAGMPIGYGRVKTLTDASVRECKGDLSEFKPVSTVFDCMADEWRVESDLCTEHHDRCPSRLGAYPKGYPYQGGPTRRSQEIDLQLGSRCQTSCKIVPYPLARWAYRRSSFQAGQGPDWWKVEIRV